MYHEKTGLAVILLAWVLLSVLLFLLFSHSLIVSPHNQFNEDLETLRANQKIYEADFEQVYLHEEYSIYPKDNLIVVELKEGDCELVLYYTQDKTYVDYEFAGPPAWTESSIHIMLWILIGLLSISLAIGIILMPIWIANGLKKSWALHCMNGRH